MALTKQIETKQGILLENAYIRIIEQSGNKKNINIRVGIFKDMEASRTGKEFLEQRLYNFFPTLEENFIKQGYEYLKTLDEYADAIDV